MGFWRLLASDPGSGGVLAVFLALLLALAGMAPAAAHSADGIVLCEAPSADGANAGAGDATAPADPLCLPCVVCTGTSAPTPDGIALALPPIATGVSTPDPAQPIRPALPTGSRLPRGPPFPSV